MSIYTLIDGTSPPRRDLSYSTSSVPPAESYVPRENGEDL